MEGATLVVEDVTLEDSTVANIVTADHFEAVTFSKIFMAKTTVKGDAALQYNVGEDVQL